MSIQSLHNITVVDYTIHTTSKLVLQSDLGFLIKNSQTDRTNCFFIKINGLNEDYSVHTFGSENVNSTFKID